jgi:hypothetical protein
MANQMEQGLSLFLMEGNILGNSRMGKSGTEHNMTKTQTRIQNM